MKKTVLLLLAALLALGGLAGCAQNAPVDPDALRVVVTVFPAYDWARNVLGENPANVQLALLLDGSADLHSFQPSVADLAAIDGADLFVSIGGVSDKWTDDALQNAKDTVSLRLLDAIGTAALTEEVVEGMQSEEEDGDEADEHIWLSLRNAKTCVTAIADALAGIDPEHASLYRANAETYGAKLTALDRAYADAVASAARDTLLFADRFPFRYLTEDYDLRYYAAFAGCSAETEASFETVRFLAQKLDETGISTVLVIEGADRRVAETVISATQAQNQTIRVLDSMQSVTQRDMAAGTTYLGIMEQNLDVLKAALSE